ncbi:MT-A70 family methyltransferase [Corallococcus aberystwythensis]|uniref:MT-A70 family methyltransferase n=1 Tax=Corallococcus aberystwythensis TaxID=2316722 RepID=UPI0013153059
MSPLIKPYGTIIADPPWKEQGGGKIKRGADRHYPLMSLKDIIALGPRVKAIAAPDCHLYLWTTNNFLIKAGAEVLPAWGFTYITCITWEKENIGIGQYFRGTTEHVLFARKGQPPYRKLANGKRAQGKTGFATQETAIQRSLDRDGTWFFRRKTRHSEKPSTIHEWAEKVSPGPYIELFARSGRQGWDCWGDEAPSRVSF